MVENTTRPVLGARLAELFGALTRLLSGIALAVLFWLNVFNTTHMEFREFSYYLKESPFNLLWLAAAIAALFALYHVRKKFVQHFSLRWLLAILGAVALVWVLTTRFYPINDQGAVLQVARQMRVGDFSEFAPGKYMNRFPEQAGIVFLLYLLNLMFGAGDYVAFQVLSVGGLLLFVWSAYHITALYWHRPGLSAGIALALALFYPLIMYCSFIYAVLIGLGLGLFSLYLQALYFATGQKRLVLLSAVVMALACLFKPNFYIYAIALGIFYVLHWMKKWDWQALVCLICGFVGVYMVFNLTFDRLCEGRMHYEANLPYTVMLEIGLQRGNTTTPGWYNGYPDQYTSMLIDGAQNEINALALQDLKDSVYGFATNIPYFQTFFGRKLLSEWSDPTFACCWVVDHAVNRADAGFWATLISPNGALYRLLEPGLNLALELVYLGALLYLLQYRPGQSTVPLSGLTAFLGGFVFYFFWEAKTQYTLLHFVLLIPYAAAGFCLLFERLMTYRKARLAGKDAFKLDAWKKKLAQNRMETCIKVVILFTLVLFSLPQMNELTHYSRPDLEEAYQNYLAEDAAGKFLHG